MIRGGSVRPATLSLMKLFRWAGVCAAFAIVAAACGDGDDGSASDTTTATTDTVVSTSAAPGTSAATTAPSTESTTPVTTAPATTAASAAVEPWTAVPGGPDCMCSDGSEFELWERPADTRRVVLYLEGGGACFDAFTCGPDTATFTQRLELGSDPGATGIFDDSDPRNPVAGHSIVYVPYCTGDAHLGDNTVEYTETLTIEHNGFVNASAGLDLLVENYPDAEQVVVVGLSAGSIPAPAFAGLVADALPDADVVSIGDSSAAYPDVPTLNVDIGGRWGVFGNVPDWPVNDGLEPQDWSIPRLTIAAGTQHPDITFARFDYDADNVQSIFLGLTGTPPEVSLLANMDDTEAQIEAAGVDVASFVAPGEGHTIMRGAEFYDLEVDGVTLLEFVTALVDGDVPADVTCTECVR